MKAKRIQEIAEEYQSMTTAPLGFAFCDLGSEESCFVNADRLFPIASVFKIFVLAELMRMVERAEISLETRIAVGAGESAQGSGLLRNLRPGYELTVYDFAYLMMSYSDNTATDIIMHCVTPEKITADVLERLDLKDTRIELNCDTLVRNAYVEASPIGERFPDGRRSFRNAPYFACTSEKNNQSTPRELMRGIRMLFSGEMAGPEGTREALDIMKKCALNMRIPMALPSNVEVAHKTGSLDRVANDVGIVYTDKGSYILVLLYNGNCAGWDEYYMNSKHKIGNSLLSRLSGEVYEAYIAD